MSATMRLVIVTLVWGISFPCTNAWQKAARGSPADGLLAALTLIALRMMLGLIVLIVWQPRLLAARRVESWGGLVVGLTFLAGFILQTWGMSSTTPALSAFFTCLSSAWVPLVVLCLGERVPLVTLGGLGLGLVGCAVLVDGWKKLGAGEWLTVGASVIFAVQMILLDRFGKALRPAMLSPAFLIANAVAATILTLLLAARGPGFDVWWHWLTTTLSEPLMPALVVLLAVFPTALGFHWMNTHQPEVSPSQAAVIYLLEPVFATTFSMILWAITNSKDYDAPSWPLFMGGVLILGGNLVVELFGVKPKPSEPLPVSD